ncbi:MAG: FAD-binding oxidoreductase [Rhodospirillales bacterium]|nr:FAD-binding oxidoreductase [Rhodospirillales bacterium]MDE2198419.1 FAD-binding oxidoreductase [Rhodospirillales bacterium]MDE2574853.1 FAD-binding oxidoreductase [Rhodospirillales bacterium]
MPGPVIVIGAGSIGIAVAYYLVRHHRVRGVILVDPLDPMSLTSAQSGENYRNWWPHPVMTAFTDDSIGLLEQISAESGNRINMTRRGYALVTRRAAPTELIDDLHRGYGVAAGQLIRIHEGQGAGASYTPPVSAAWDQAPDGVDVLCDQALIRRVFPTYAPDVATVLHIRRAGAISGQQLGQVMLEAIRAAGGRLLRGRVAAIEGAAPFALAVQTADGPITLRADRLVNAAGPFVGEVAALLGETLPVSCVYQQKIAFADRHAAIPRTLPFTIDLDGQELSWSEEERSILAEDPAAARLLAPMPGGIHCRPDGAADGQWIKLGWAYNTEASDPHADAPSDPQFPDTVLRAASRLHPALKAYIGHLPRGAHHYGGYYAMTAENWPLIGPMQTRGAYLAGAMSGFGTMAACAAGSLCAAWVMGGALPSYAPALSPGRYQDTAIMSELAAMRTRGVL